LDDISVAVTHNFLLPETLPTVFPTLRTTDAAFAAALLQLLEENGRGDVVGAALRGDAKEAISSGQDAGSEAAAAKAHAVDANANATASTDADAAGVVAYLPSREWRSLLATMPVDVGDGPAFRQLYDFHAQFAAVVSAASDENATALVTDAGASLDERLNLQRVCRFHGLPLADEVMDDDETVDADDEGDDEGTADENAA
jgi:tRNA(Arg) A34 adenosine deaminase TadA